MRIDVVDRPRHVLGQVYSRLCIAWPAVARLYRDRRSVDNGVTYFWVVWSCGLVAAGLLLVCDVALDRWSGDRDKRILILVP